MPDTTDRSVTIGTTPWTTRRDIARRSTVELVTKLRIDAAKPSPSDDEIILAEHDPLFREFGGLFH